VTNWAIVMKNSARSMTRTMAIVGTVEKNLPSPTTLATQGKEHGKLTIVTHCRAAEQTTTEISSPHA